MIHQGYGDHSRKAVIEFFTHGIKFWNPGDSFAVEKHLLAREAAARIAAGFQRIPSAGRMAALRPGAEGVR